MAKVTPKKPAVRRRSPTQQRSQTTVEAIVTAAAQILERDGTAAMTTNAIAVRAGVSIGTLYQYFANRDALLAALVVRHTAAMRSVIAEPLATLADLPLPTIVERLVAAIIAAHQVAPRLHHALQTTVTPQTQATIYAFEAELEQMVAVALRVQRGLHLADPQLIASVLVRALGGLVRTTLQRDPLRFHDPALAAAMQAMILGTLASASTTPISA